MKPYIENLLLVLIIVSLFPFMHFYVKSTNTLVSILILMIEFGFILAVLLNIKKEE